MIKILKTELAFNRDVLTLMTGTIVAQAIPVAISPILTRIYTPEDFGLFALYVAFSSVLGATVTGRYELAIMLPKKRNDAFQIAILASLITLVISGLILVIVILFNYDIALLLQNPEIAPWLYFMPISVLLTGLYQTLNYWFNRHKCYSDIATNRVINNGVTSLSQIGLVGYAQSAGLVVGQLVGQVFSLAYFIKIVFRKDFFHQRVDPIKIRALARRYSQFPLIGMPTVIINTAANQVPIVLLGAIFSASSVGFYYLTQRVLQAPVTLISGSILDVFKQRASEDYKKNGDCKEIFKKTFWALLLMAAPMSLILYLFIEDLFAFVFGEDWREAGVYAKLLIPAVFLKFIANPLSFIAYIVGKQIYNLTAMIFLVFGLVLCFISSESVYESIFKLSIIQVIYYIYFLVLSARLAKLI